MNENEYGNLKGDLREIKVHLEAAKEDIHEIKDFMQKLLEQEPRLVQLETELGFVKKGFLLLGTILTTVAGWWIDKFWAK